MIPRLKAAIRYVYLSDRPWNWRLHAGRCPACAGRLFISFGRTAFHTRCLTCRSTLVNLSMIPLINSHCGGAFEGKSAYEMSSYGATYNYLLKAFPEVYFSEYMEGRPLGAIVDGLRNEDATRLTYADESFDIVTSNQVFEHVHDDIRAYSECYRVIRAGGALIFTVPLYDTPATVRVAQLSGGTIKWIGTPEYHDSRLGGPHSAPVFWRHSIHDIASRVKDAGFSKVNLVPISVLKHTDISQPVIYAIK
jgi:SAM-dependent methyltransferase